MEGCQQPREASSQKLLWLMGNKEVGASTDSVDSIPLMTTHWGTRCKHPSKEKLEVLRHQQQNNETGGGDQKIYHPYKATVETAGDPMVDQLNWTLQWEKEMGI